MSNDRNVHVWDLPTRVFHWSLLALVLIAWFTGEEEGTAAAVHRYAGEGIAGLLVFRVIWGFIGGEHARFADFAAGPRAIIAHIGDLSSAQPKRHLGHNPLGGIAVFLLLAIVAGVVVTGLFSSGHESAGPFATAFGRELLEVHEILFRVLQGLVVVHVLGVIVETLKAKDALLPAMITGSKRRGAGEPGADAKRAGSIALIAATLAGVLVSAWLASLPIPASAAPERDLGHQAIDRAEHDERDE